MKGKKTTNQERRIKAEGDSIERKRIFKELCDHVARGYSVDCFAVLSSASIYCFMKKYPEEFVQEELDEAIRNGKVHWEDIGRRQATGECMGNSRTWYYNMANRYGWREKLDIEAEHKGQVNVNVISFASQKSLTDKQED